MIHEPVAETTTEDRREPSGTRLAVWLAVVLTLIAANYAGRFLVEAPADEDSRDVLYQWSTFFAALIQFGILLGITLLLTVGYSTRELLALRRPRSWKRAAGLAVLVVVGTYVVAGIVGALGADPGEEQGLVACFVPVVEELMFRGLGFSLLARYGVPAAIVGTGVLFALGHGVVEGLPIFVFLGLGLAFIRHRSDSVYPTIGLHACFNALALVIAVTVGGGA
jgi:membrane protease YdiL (CAAX protease family)